MSGKNFREVKTDSCFDCIHGFRDSFMTARCHIDECELDLRGGMLRDFCCDDFKQREWTMNKGGM